MFISPRPPFIAWIIFLILLILWTPFSWYESSRGRSSGPSSASQVVTDSGFSLSLDGVTITGDSSVAPLNTSVQATLIQAEIPESIADFAEPVGTGVEITLGDNLQPETPLTVTFSASEVTEWYAATEGDEDLIPVVFASNDSERGVEFADASLMPDGSVSVVTYHLSSLYPGVVSATDFSGRLVEEVATFIGVRTEQPACVSYRTIDQSWAFSAVPGQILWPCVKESGGSLEVSLTNNSSGVWFVTSSQERSLGPSILSFPGIVIAAAAWGSVDSSVTAPLVPSDGSVSFSISNPDDEIVFEAELNHALTAVNAVTLASLSFLPSAKVQAVLQDIGRAECFVSVVTEAIDPSFAVDGSFMRTIVGCMGAIIGGMPGSVFSSVTAVPGLLVTSAETTYRTLDGSTTVSFTLSRANSTSTGSSSWPTDRDDGPGRLYVWLGANFYAYPDWVACDDAREWCLVGNDGDRHLLVRMDDLTAMYWLDDTIDNPREALLSTGLTEDVVAEILGE